MKYEQTVGGYFYKVYKNGDRKRVSKEVFQKNVMMGGSGGGGGDGNNNIEIYREMVKELFDEDSIPNGVNTMSWDNLHNLEKKTYLKKRIKLFLLMLKEEPPENFNNRNYSQLSILHYTLRERVKELLKEYGEKIPNNFNTMLYNKLSKYHTELVEKGGAYGIRYNQQK